jgi:uncharacterized alpha-E superfamily protein
VIGGRARATGAGEDADGPHKPIRLPPGQLRAQLSSRGADDMFWLGRYAERAEDVVRLLRVCVDLSVDHSRRPASVGGRGLAVLLQTLTEVTTTYPGFLAGTGTPMPELVRLSVDALTPGSLAHAVRHTVESAQAVREQLSNDTWLVLAGLDRELTVLRRSGDPELHLQQHLSRILEGLLGFSGLAMESMVRDAGWYLMDAGRRIERALQLVSLLRHTLTEARAAAVDDLVLESVLIGAESVITHRRRYPGRPRVADVLTLLLLDRANPRGVLHQLDRLADDLRNLPDSDSDSDTGPADPRARLARIQALLRETDTTELARLHPAPPGRSAGSRPALLALLERLQLELTELAEVVARAYFTRATPPRLLPATPTLDLR